jgi:ABC-type bacteriocin/lantibiotic exporter with double-glycine peptidase domain
MANTTTVLAMAGCLALSGCALQSRREGGVRLGVPMIRQQEAGLASARMVARYYSVPLSPRAERLMRLASSNGGELSSEELKAGLEASGYRVTLSSAELPELYAHLDRGEPVIVVVGATFMLLDGYGHGHVVLLDPKRGVVRAEAGDFDRAWGGSRRLALVAVR